MGVLETAAQDGAAAATEKQVAAADLEKDQESQYGGGGGAGPAAAGAPDNVPTDYPTGGGSTSSSSDSSSPSFCALDMSIIGTAAPSITTEFHSVADVGWYGSSFAITLAAFQSHWGKAYLYFQLKWSFLSSIFVFEVGSLVCGVAPSSVALIVGRAVQGAGAAGITGGCYTIASFIVPPARVPAITGLLGSVFTLASVAGPLLGGAFTSNVSWRWCFYINLPIGGVAFAALVFLFHTPEQSKTMVGKLSWRQILEQFDPIGTTLLISSLVCFVLVMQWGGISKAWGSADVVGVLVGWFVMSVAFAVNEWLQGDKALIVYRLLRNRDIAVCCGFIFFMMCGNQALYYNLPVYFQAIGGDSAMASGLKFIPTILCTSTVTFLTVVLIGKYNIYQPFLIAGAVLQTLGVGLYYLFDLDTGLGPIIGYQIIYGIGSGLGIQTAIAVGQTVSAVEDISMTLATIIFFQFGAGAYGVSSTNSVLDNILIQKLDEYVPQLTHAEVFTAGATGIQDQYSGATLLGIRMSFLEGVRASMVLACAFLGVSIFWSLAPKWPGRMERLPSRLKSPGGQSGRIVRDEHQRREGQRVTTKELGILVGGSKCSSHSTEVSSEPRERE